MSPVGASLLWFGIPTIWRYLQIKSIAETSDRSKD